jgi:hypothetical protein
MLTHTLPTPSIKPPIYTKKLNSSDQPLRPKRSVELVIRKTNPFGGQHRAPSGDTTRPTDAQFEWFQGEVQAAINNVDWASPF